MKDTRFLFLLDEMQDGRYAVLGEVVADPVIASKEDPTFPYSSAEGFAQDAFGGWTRGLILRATEAERAFPEAVAAWRAGDDSLHCQAVERDLAAYVPGQ